MAVSTRSDRTSLIGGMLPHPDAAGVSSVERAVWVGLYNRSLIYGDIDNDRGVWFGLGLESIHVFPDPDGTLTFADRAQFLNLQRNLDTGGVSAEITGVESVTEIGSLTVAISIDVQLSGVASVATAGTLNALSGAVAVPASAQSNTSAGNIGVTTTGASLWFNGEWFNSVWFNSDWFNTETGITVNLESVSSSPDVGSLSVVGNSVLTLDGVESSVELGGLSVTAGVSVSVGISGVSATSGIGSLDAIAGSAVIITGTEATGEAGTLTAIDVSNIIAGVESTASVGALSIAADSVVSIFGVGAAFQIGDLAASEYIPPIIPDEPTWDEEDDETGLWTIHPPLTGTWN